MPTVTSPRGEDPLLTRLNRIIGRLDEVIEDGNLARTKLDRLDVRIEESLETQRRALEQLERNVDEKVQARVTEGVRAALQSEIGVLRPPIEAQAARLAAVENRLERVETIQVESMNALDARFGDLAAQTRIALAAGGLIALGAIMVVLLR
jgi:ElaB/YqjD/DUF883 family membrane-anchored ribosome-binding protein